jgi:hypothetical protein
MTHRQTCCKLVCIQTICLAFGICSDQKEHLRPKILLGNRPDPTCGLHYIQDYRAMTLAEINRMIRAAIRAARKEGAPLVEVKIGDEASIRIPLVPDKAIAESEEIVL